MPEYPNRKKKDEPSPPPVGEKCNGLCGRTNGIDGTVLKVCAGCKTVSYCSTECQRKSWPGHKIYCKLSVDQNLRAFAYKMLGDQPLRQWIYTCLIKEFSITMENMFSMARKPLYAEMNIGVEPTDVALVFQLQRSKNPSAFNHKGVQGIVQVHHIIELARVPSYANFAIDTPQMVHAWKEIRASMDRAMRGYCPLIILRVVDGFQGHCFIHSIPLFVPDIEEAWMQQPFKKIMLLDPPAQPKPNDIAVCETINHLNEMIRADTKNKMRMRTPFRPCDKRLLIDAAYGSDLQHVHIALRAKIFREPIYQSYALAHITDATGPWETYFLICYRKWEAEKKRQDSLA